MCIKLLAPICKVLWSKGTKRNMAFFKIGTAVLHKIPTSSQQNMMENNKLGHMKIARHDRREKNKPTIGQ